MSPPRTSDKVKLAVAITALVAATLLILEPFDDRRVAIAVDKQALAEIEAEQQRIEHEAGTSEITVNGS